MDPFERERTLAYPPALGILLHHLPLREDGPASPVWGFSFPEAPVLQLWGKLTRQASALTEQGTLLTPKQIKN